MRLRVVARPQAEADIDEIAAYILEDSFDAAVRFLEAAERAFDSGLAWKLSARGLRPG